MEKADIVQHVSSKEVMTQTAAKTAVGAVFAPIAEALAHGEDGAVTGSGRFAGTEWPAREGRNPRTGKRIAIGPK